MAGMDEQAHDPVPKRRWFRYSLRTLFVVVTVVCCWLGYHLNWIAQRHAFLADETLVRERHPDPAHASMSAGIAWRDPQAPRRAPGMLWIFGEGGWTSFGVLVQSRSVDDLTDHDWDRISDARSLFPESEVIAVHVWDTSHAGIVSSRVKGSIPPKVRPAPGSKPGPLGPDQKGPAEQSRHGH